MKNKIQAFKKGQIMLLVLCFGFTLFFYLFDLSLPFWQRTSLFNLIRNTFAIWGFLLFLTYFTDWCFPNLFRFRRDGYGGLIDTRDEDSE